MIDQEIKDMIIYRKGIIVDEQSGRLMRGIDRLKSDAALRGFSSMPGQIQCEIKELYERFYSNLPRLIIQEMRDVLLKANPKPSQELSRYLKDIISSCSINRNDLMESLLFQGIDSAIADTIIINPPSRFFPEIDLIIKEIENNEREERVKHESSTTIGNINATNVIVQTGNNTKASIVINKDNKQELCEAIDILLNAISNAKDFHSGAKEETKELILEMKSEVEKPKPNGIKLKSLLFGIATAIQSLASIKPAYEALKTAASVIGISLP